MFPLDKSWFEWIIKYKYEYAQRGDTIWVEMTKLATKIRLYCKAPERGLSVRRRVLLMNKESN